MQLKSLGNLSNALNVIKAAPGSFNAVSEAVKILNTQNTAATLTTSALSKQQQLQILINKGLSAEQANAALTTSTLSAAEKGATTSTLGLNAAAKGLSLTLKANPILGIMAIGTAVFAAVSYFKRLSEESARAAQEATDAYSDTSKSIEDYTKRYQDLHKALLDAKGNEEDTYNVKKQLLDLQIELNDKFGDEYDKVNLVTDAYNDQTDAIKNRNKEAAQDYLNKDPKGIKAATKDMTGEKTYHLNQGDQKTNSVEGQALLDVVKKYQDKGISVDNIGDNYEDATFSIILDANAENAKKTINDFMNDVRDKAKELGDEDIFKDVIQISSNSLKDAQKTIDDSGEQYYNGLKSQIEVDDKLSAQYEKATQAVNDYNNAVLKSTDPLNDEKVKDTYKHLSEVKSEIQGNKEEWEKYSSTFNKVFDQADTRMFDFRNELDALRTTDKSKHELPTISIFRQLPPSSINDFKGKSSVEAEAMLDANEGNKYKDLISLAKKYSLSIKDIVSSLKDMGIVFDQVGEKAFTAFSKEEMISAIDGLSEGFESLDKIMSSMKGKNPFDYALLDDKKFKDTFSTVGKEYTDFIDQISSSPKDVKACQGAFDNLVTSWLNSTDILGGLSDDTKQLTIDMLEQKGVANAEEIITAALTEKHAQVAAQKFYNAKSSVTLAKNTIDEYGALLNEADAAQVSKEALAQLELSKIATNNVKIDTASDIDQVINLANAAGSSAEALGKLARAKSIFAQTESGSFNLNVPGNNLLLAEAENTVSKLGNGTFDYEFNIDPNKFKSATYGGGTKSNKSSGSGGSKGKSKEPTEFDWMSQKIKGIDSQVDKLQDKIDILVGYKGKNATTDTVIDRLIEKMSTFQLMHDKYMEEAGKLGLSQDYINKIQNGSIEIETIGDENLAKIIKDYQSLYDKAEDANKQIHDTQKKVDGLNLSKLDNIINQFNQLGDTQSKIIDTQKQFITLREKTGDEIYADDYTSLIEQQGALIKNSADAYRILKSEMNSMNLKQGSEEWKKYNDQLREYQQNMISSADAVKEYMNAIVELKFKGLKDFKSQMDSIGNTISTMSDLIGGVGLTDDSGKLTDLGLAKMALYAQQLANAKQETANYGEAISSLDDMLNDGLITQDEYNQRLYDYTSAQNSAISASKQAKDAILDLVKNGIQTEIDAKKKLVDETKAALDAEQNLHDYQKSISEKQDGISKLERQIAALSNSTSRDDIAKRLQLQSELKKAQEDLYETQYDHEIQQRKDALDKQLEDFTESKDKEKEELDSDLDKQNTAINKYLNQVKDKYSTVYGVLTQYGNEYSMEAIKDLTNPWEEGGTAADLCGDAVGSAIANIQTSIDSLNLSPLYDLIDAFNSLGMAHGGVGATGSMNFEDISEQGHWQKGKGGKDWFGEKYNPNGDYFYASDDIYTVNGRQYGFDDQGYMQKEWQMHDGKQYYFDANDGHMVKSQWIPGRDGSQYYLLADGTMAEDMAVKDKDGSYYYVDDAGKWDGKTLTAEQVRKLGYTIGYKRGTRNATKGWHLMDEDGVGSEGILTDRGVLRQFEGGEIVLNPEAMQNLYDIAQDPTRFIRGLNSIRSNIVDIGKMQPVHSVSINSPLVQIDGTGLSANEVATIIKNETRDIDKRVAKSIKYELLGK